VSSSTPGAYELSHAEVRNTSPTRFYAVARQALEVVLAHRGLHFGVDSRRQRDWGNSWRAVSPIRSIPPFESFARSELSSASRNHSEALSWSATPSDVGFRLCTALRNAATAITHTSVIAAAIQRASVIVEAMNSAAMNVPTAKAATRRPCNHNLKRPSRAGGSVFWVSPRRCPETTIWKVPFTALSDRVAVHTGRTNRLRTLCSHRLHVVHNIEPQARPTQPSTRAGTAGHPQICRSIVGARPAKVAIGQASRLRDDAIRHEERLVRIKKKRPPRDGDGSCGCGYLHRASAQVESPLRGLNRHHRNPVLGHRIL
jgi:hypothetical protein